MKHIKLLEDFLQEGNVSMDAVYIHQITGSGQNAAQDFIDDNGLDGKKLADYVKRHRDSKEKYDVRDMIAGTGIGSDKKLKANFLKLFKESVDEMASSDVHYKEIMALYHSGPFAKKKVGAVVCKNPNATQKQIEDELQDSGYEDMIEFVDALGIVTNEAHEDLQNYMFFSNLESIKRKCESILAMDFKAIDELLNAGGHDWAADHITVAKENIDQVENFLVGQFEDDHQEIPTPSPEDKFEPEV